MGATLLFGFWIWQQGAYFDKDFFPGAFALALLCGLLLAFVLFQGRLSTLVSIALAALCALALWTTVSALWSDVPAAGPTYAGRVFAYLAAFLIGIWLILLLRERMLDAVFPLAVAGALVGVATTIVLAGGEDSSWYLHDDATLRFPIGYRNANAALMLICFWPSAALAMDNARHWLLRAGAVASGTILIELAILSQSRGSVPATIAALVVFIAVAPHRLRAAVVVGMAALPAAIALPTLLEVFRHGDDGPGVLGLLRDSAQMIWLTALISFVMAVVVFVVVYPRLKLGARRVGLISRFAMIGALVLAVAATGAFVARHGGPVEFLDQRVEEFTSIGYPDLSEQGVRYGANVGSNRADFWRVSLDTWRENPVLGAGAGSFEPIYLRERRSLETPQDPHSIEMLMLSEQGLVGLVLLLAFLAAATWAALRSRRLGARAALLSAAALASGVQWLLPASYDWFWQYAGVTAPAIFLLGAAGAPALIDPDGRLSRSVRSVGTVLAVAVALAMVPLYIADRYQQQADGLRDQDPAAAAADYRRAADLTPWSPTALEAAARTELEAGAPEKTVELAREALERAPTDYASNLVLAQGLIALGDSAAGAQLARLRELSPLAPEIELLEQEFEEASAEPKVDARHRDR